MITATDVAVDLVMTNDQTVPRWVVRWADATGQRVRTFRQAWAARTFERSLRREN